MPRSEGKGKFGQREKLLIAHKASGKLGNSSGLIGKEIKSGDQGEDIWGSKKFKKTGNGRVEIKGNKFGEAWNIGEKIMGTQFFGLSNIGGDAGQKQKVGSNELDSGGSPNVYLGQWGSIG